MPKVSAAFFLVGVLLLLGGMGLGEYMASHQDFSLMPMHAHMNLLGWVSLALYGTFYALTKETYSPRLAWLNFILSAGGVVVAMPLLYLSLTAPDGDAKYGPMAGMAAGVAMLGAAVFLISVFREFIRRHA